MDSQVTPEKVNDYKTESSLVDLLKKAVSQSSNIITCEVALMKAQMSEAGNQIKKGVIAVTLSLIFVIAGLCVTLIGFAELLDKILPDWAAYLVIGGPVLIIGIVLLIQGINNFKTKELQPEQVADSLQKDIQALKGENK